MKLLSAIIMLVLSLGAFASRDIQQFTFDGSQTSTTLSLRADKTHIEYRYEQRHEICYRRVVHYSTVCQNTPQGRVCHQVPHYRDIPYSCVRTVQIPYEVFDYHVEANVSLNISALPEVRHNETFKATLDGDRLTLTATSSGARYFVMLDKQNVTSRMNGSVKLIDASYNVSFIESAPVTKALSLTNISLKDKVLTFTMGPVEARELIGFQLQVKKAPVLGSDTVLFDRELAANEMQLSAQGEGSVVDVNINDLGIKLSSGRYTLTAKAFFKHAGTLLNASQFESTEASRTLVYKIR